MKIYAFGNPNDPVMLLLPGTSCNWKINYENHIPLLEPYFYTLAVSYDGFDETEESIFPDMITETGRIEDWLLSNCGGHVFAAYGCSLGGSFVSLLVQRRRVHIDHAIIGSSDLDQSGPASAFLKTAVLGPILTPLVREGRIPGFFKKQIEKADPAQRAYTQALLSAFTAGGRGQPYIQKKSILNQFRSDLVTRIDDAIDVPGTRIHVFYAAKMGEIYEKRYRRHYAHPDIRIHDMAHEELFFLHPQEWLQEVLRACHMAEEDGNGIVLE